MTDRKRFIESSERVPTRSEILKPMWEHSSEIDIDDLPVPPKRAETSSGITRPSSDGVPLTLTGEQRKRLQRLLEKRAAALKTAAADLAPMRTRRATADLREQVLRRRARMRG
jgi:hypothetical protein